MDEVATGVSFVVIPAKAADVDITLFSRDVAIVAVALLNFANANEFGVVDCAVGKNTNVMSRKIAQPGAQQLIKKN